MRFPAFDAWLPDGKSWIRAEAGDTGTGFELDELEGFAQTDPRELLEALRTVTSEIEPAEIDVPPASEVADASEVRG